MVPPGENSNNPECEDDQKLIDLAIAGNADFLITRDHALLAMDREASFTIMDDSAFRLAIHVPGERTNEIADTDSFEL